ncbi:CgeB family protein [Pseudonocardia cypriaca]|uniref:Glycosyl transferase family 1 n=1 Tax=Pseudonocardia cypriaca TaxID=882449 RepID=A0A543GAI9_9PSEU|nr:glycosyltransferase [Pseudonocardia cypriaca]TQM43101.1 glycosyl transferase family 1 [Pseudonocardia cypriaca]
MKILYIGDDWIGSNARSLAEGFRQAGHEVVAVDTTPVTLPRRLSAPWIHAKLAGRRAPWSVEAVHRRIEQIAAELHPDLVFAFKTVHLDQRRLLDVPAYLHVHYSPDDVSNPYNTTPGYLEWERAWDLVVTTKRHNVPELLARGARAVKFVPSAYDPAWHRPCARRAGRQYLVGFIGACRPDRRGPLVDLARRYGDRMLLRGPGWRRVPQLRRTRATVAAAVYGEQLSVAVASVTANLVLLNSANRDTHTCRTFEVPAAGGLFVGERTAEHEALFDDGTECLLFSTAEELHDRLRWCDERPDLARKVAESGYRRIVRGRHRYVDRAAEIVATFH